MRKKVIVLVSLLFVLVDMYAQTFYYDTTQVFYAQRYVCDVTQESKSVRLYIVKVISLQKLKLSIKKRAQKLLMLKEKRQTL